MAARRLGVYTTESVMKFWNSDAVDDDCCSSIDDSSLDDTSSVENSKFTEDLEPTSDFCGTNSDATLSVVDKPSSNDESLLVRSDILFASSDEEDDIDSESSGQSIHENVGEETAEEDTHSVEDFSPTCSRDLEFSPESSDTDVLSHHSDQQEGSGVDSDISDDVAPISRGRSRGRGRPRGRSRASRRGLSTGRSGGQPSRGARRPTSYLEMIPSCAIPIATLDNNHSAPPDFNPLRVPGPHLPPGTDPTSELDYFRLFFDDEVLDNLVTATNEYAEDKKDQLKSMYRRFIIKPLTRDEMLGYIGVLIHLGINSVRNYKQVWNIKSSQVSGSWHCHEQNNVMQTMIQTKHNTRNNTQKHSKQHKKQNTQINTTKIKQKQNTNRNIVINTTKIKQHK